MKTQMECICLRWCPLRGKETLLELKRAVAVAVKGGKGGGGAPGLIARESRKKTRRLAIDNGFIASSIQRARKLHEAVWSVIEARNGAHSPFVSAQMTDAANEGKAFLLENGLARENRSGQYEDTTEQQSLLITADELWKGLTVNDFTPPKIWNLLT